MRGFDAGRQVGRQAGKQAKQGDKAREGVVTKQLWCVSCVRSKGLRCKVAAVGLEKEGKGRGARSWFGLALAIGGDEKGRARAGITASGYGYGRERGLGAGAGGGERGVHTVGRGRSGKGLSHEWDFPFTPPPAVSAYR